MENHPGTPDDLARMAMALDRQLALTAPNIPEDMRRKLANIGAMVKARPSPVIAPSASPDLPKPVPGKALNFPAPFGADTLAVSNPFARCALFAPVRQRRHFKDYVCLGEVEGLKIEIKGEQLNQDDHDTYVQLLMLASRQPIGGDVRLSVNTILRRLGRETHQSQRQQLFAELDRLVTTSLRITVKGMPSLVGHLIDDASTPQEQAVLPQYQRHIAYRLNPKFARFFQGTAYTLFDWQERLKLKGRGGELAKWLHFWIIGHAKQYPHKVETLRDKCGSADKNLKSFRQKLRQALDLLKAAGIITAWRIDGADLVHIDRTPSRAQSGHLAKQSGKARNPGSRGLKKAVDLLG